MRPFCCSHRLPRLTTKAQGGVSLLVALPACLNFRHSYPPLPFPSAFPIRSSGAAAVGPLAPQRLAPWILTRAHQSWPRGHETSMRVTSASIDRREPCNINLNLTWNTNGSTERQLPFCSCSQPASCPARPCPSVNWSPPQRLPSPAAYQWMMVSSIEFPPGCAHFLLLSSFCPSLRLSRPYPSPAPAPFSPTRFSFFVAASSLLQFLLHLPPSVLSGTHENSPPLGISLSTLACCRTSLAP